MSEITIVKYSYDSGDANYFLGVGEINLGDSILELLQEDGEYDFYPSTLKNPQLFDPELGGVILEGEEKLAAALLFWKHLNNE